MTAFIEAADTALVLARENIEETQIEAVESEVVVVAVATESRSDRDRHYDRRIMDR